METIVDFFIGSALSSWWCHDPSFVEVIINFLHASNEGEEDW
jgi:hypothetical protein